MRLFGNIFNHCDFDFSFRRNSTRATLKSSLRAHECNFDFVYCDTDELDINGAKSSPRFLPNWNPELQYSTAYINTGVMIKTALLKSVQISNQTTIAGAIAICFEIYEIDEMTLSKYNTFCL